MQMTVKCVSEVGYTIRFGLSALSILNSWGRRAMAPGFAYAPNE